MAQSSSLKVRSLATVCLLLGSLTACDDAEERVPRGPCAAGTLSGCGAVCTTNAECGLGLYCDDGACYAECASDSYVSDCGVGQGCSVDGRCTSAAIAGGDGGDGTSGSGMGSIGKDGICADISLRARLATPNVVLIVDQSGSMTAKFGSGTRWSVLKGALLSDTGIISEFQGVVRFGLALFTYGKGDAVCPVVTPGNFTVTLDALSGIRDVYLPAEPRDNTPTGESVDAVLAQVSTLGLVGPDTEPTIFILATDGNPDTCALPDQGAFGSANSLVATKRSIEAVQNAYAAGVSTYVIAVADENDLAQTHVNDLANAGVGKPAGLGVSDAPSYRVDDDQGLRDALRTIVSGQQSCNVKLDGRVVGDACQGKVTLDGMTLPCNDPNGWKLIDESTIELEGAACDGVKSGKPLTATFPCETVVVI